MMTNNLTHGADTRRIKPSRRRGESGASLVEAALIILPFLALFMALFDFGMMIFLKNTMQFAVRQGCRYAITSQVMTGQGQLASIQSQVNTYSFGFLNYLAPGPPKTACSGTGCVTVSFYYQDLSTTPSTLTLVTGAGSNAQGNVVVVTAAGLAYTYMMPLSPTWWAGRTVTPLNISVSSADIMEAQPNGAPTL
jgi:Flp pilus assembly protein TadG